jgi:hypothetical protein
MSEIFVLYIKSIVVLVNIIKILAQTLLKFQQEMVVVKIRGTDIFH